MCQKTKAPMKLKIYLLLLIVITAYNYQLCGQTISAKADLNSSSLKGEPIPEVWGLEKEIKKSGIGPHAGIFLEIPVKENFSLQAGLIVSHKGESIELIFKDTTIQKRLYNKSSLYYLELPVTGKYSVRLYKNTTIYALAGLYFGYGIIGRTEYSYDLYGKDYAGYYDTWERHGSNIFKRTDAGAIAGIGFQMGSIGLEYNYYMGLKDVYNNDSGSTFQVMKLSLTYRIGKLK